MCVGVCESESSGTWCSSSQGSHWKFKSRTNLWEMQGKKATTGGRVRGNSCAKDWHDTTLGVWLSVCLFFSFLFPSFCPFSFFHLFFLPSCHFFPLFLLIIHPCCLYAWYRTFTVSAKLQEGKLEGWRDEVTLKTGCQDAWMQAYPALYWPGCEIEEPDELQERGFIECMLCKLTRPIIQHKCQYKHVNSWLM